MTERRGRDLFTPLLVALAVILILAFQVFRPFLITFAVSGSVALLLAPVHRRLTRGFGARPTLAARFPMLREWMERGESRLAPIVSGALGQLAGTANNLLQGVLTGFTRALFDLLLFLVTLFFLLRDGALLRSELRPISPFSEVQERQIFDHLGKTVKGALQSMIVVPLAQGLVAGLGFVLFGVPSPLVWGAAVILAAMVPILGSPLGWVPACVYLFLTAETWQWVGMLVYGVAGFLVGPVILSLVLSAIRIYRMDVLRPPSGPAMIVAGTEKQADVVSASVS